MVPWFSKKVVNDIHLSLSFLMLYAAINTQTHILKTLTVSIHDDNPDYNVDGFTCFGILYTVTAFISWLTPCVFLVIGLKAAMILGFICEVPFIFTCYSENELFTYTSTVICAIGTAILWVAQSNYIVLNSEVGNVYQSIGCFWFFYKISYILGDIIVFFQFIDPQQPVDRELRGRLTIILLTFVLVAFIAIIFLRDPMRSEDREGKSFNFLTEIRLAYSIFNWRTFVILSIIYIYIGTNLTFMSVMGASMGFSEYLSENSKKYAPLSGVLQGVGELMGSTLSLYLKNKPTLCKGKLLLVIGCVSNLISYTISYLTLPDESAFTYTNALPIVKLPVEVLFLANVLIGFGDANIQIEIYHCVGALFPNDSVSAFGILYFFWGIATASLYFYSTAVGIQWQLILLTSLCLISLILYYFSKSVTSRFDEREELILYASQVPQYNAEQTKSENAEAADGGVDNLVVSHL